MYRLLFSDEICVILLSILAKQRSPSHYRKEAEKHSLFLIFIVLLDYPNENEGAFRGCGTSTEFVLCKYRAGPVDGC